MKTAASTSRYTLLIVTWKGDDLLRDCLDSLVRALPILPPCVVVDNAPLESTRILCAEYPFVTYVAAPHNLGFAGGNNLGLPYCKTDYICLLNNDTRVLADSFSPLVDFLDAHPSAAVAQGTLVMPRFNGALDECGSCLTRLGLQHYRFLREMPCEDLVPATVFAAKGAFMMIRRAVLDLLGGVLFYDDFMSYYEEKDFCHRVWLVGAEVWFVPTPPIEHICWVTTAKFDNARVWRQYLGNIFFSYLANFSVSGYVRMLLPFSLAYGAYLAKNLLQGRWRHFVAAMKVPCDLWQRRTNIIAARRRVQGSRKLSDAELLSKTLI